MDDWPCPRCDCRKTTGGEHEIDCPLSPHDFGQTGVVYGTAPQTAGWECHKCGRVLAYWVAVCPCYKERKSSGAVYENQSTMDDWPCPRCSGPTKYNTCADCKIIFTISDSENEN